MEGPEDLNPFQELQVLSYYVSEQNYGIYRVLVDSRIIKYIDIESDVFENPNIYKHVRLLLLELPTFPPGLWNVGTISKSKHGQLYFSKTELVNLTSVTEIWHPKTYDFLQLNLERNDEKPVNRVLASPYNFDIPVIAKTAEWPRNIPENGRVIGFLLEEIKGRYPGPQDFDVCCSVLSKLHDMGMTHGDVNRYNFVIRDEDHKAVILDFTDVEAGASAEDCAEEIDMLRDMLNNTPWPASLAFRSEQLR